MMRKFAVALTACTLAVSALGQGEAPMLSQGTQEVRLGGGIDMDTFADTRLDLQVGYAYFLQDLWQVGGLFDIQNDDFVTFWAIGGFTEYNFDMGTELVPYIGGALYFSGADVEELDSNEAVLAEASLGGKYFFRPQIALFSQLDFRFASDDVFDEEGGKISDNEVRIKWGIRYFFE